MHCFLQCKTDEYKIIQRRKLGSTKCFPSFSGWFFCLCSCCVWTSQDCFISQTSPNAGYRAVETEYLKILVRFFVLFLLLSMFSVLLLFCMSECLVISQTFPQCVQESSSIWVSPTSPKIDTNPPLPHLTHWVCWSHPGHCWSVSSLGSGHLFKKNMCSFDIKLKLQRVNT